MTPDQLREKQQALYRRVLAGVDWPAMREYAASRIESHRLTMETCDPSEVQKLQGQIAELRYLATADETIRKKLNIPGNQDAER